ncbi:MAG: hypothetical protein J5J00_15275 [Deltaproteobacteria bacterium]|nr:hypothetical protein [Deltaproteobacteria bacterium]
MSKTEGKRPSSPGLKVKAPALPAEGEDFSTSMARLAELAAQNLGPDRNEDRKNTIEEEALLEYLTPKRKKKDGADKDEISSKVKINPYVIIGLLVVFLSAGFLAIPRIVAQLDEPVDQTTAEKRTAAQASAAGDKKMKTYTVADAIQDVAAKGELKTASISDLAKMVSDSSLAQSTGFELFGAVDRVQLGGAQSLSQVSQESSSSEPTYEHSLAHNMDDALPIPDLNAMPEYRDFAAGEFNLPSDCENAEQVMQSEDDAIFYLQIIKAARGLCR